MSLNWKEIDLLLEELPLEGSHLQELRQPDYRNLYLYFYRPGGGFWLRVCLENRSVRLHRTSYPPKKPKKPQRFAEFLKKRINGGRVTEVEHVNQDRVIRLTVERAGERTELYIRLWGGSANMVAVDDTGTILDAFFRKPKRGIASGLPYELPPVQEPPPREIRQWHGSSFNDYLDHEFRQAEKSDEVGALLAALDKWWERESSALRRRRESFF